MTVPEHIAELWLRHETGLPLSDEEQAMLLWSLSHDEGLRKSLLNDSAFDAQLHSVSRLESSEDAFVAEFSRRLATAGPSEAPPVMPVATAVWLEPPPVHAIPPAVLVSPLPDVRPTVSSKSGARSAARWPRKLDPTLALACSVFVVAGAVALYATIWRKPTDDSRPVVQHNETSPLNDHVRPFQSPNQGTVAASSPPLGIPAVRTTEAIPPDSWPSPWAQSPKLATRPVWKTGGPRIDRLPAGRHELLDGLVAVRLEGGREIELAAPALLDVGADDALTLLHGTLRTTKLAADKTLTVDTPTSRVFDRGGRFEVAVDDAGSTRVLVSEGRVACQPGSATDKPGKLFELSDDALNRLQVFHRIAAAGLTGPATAVASVATGSDNQFLGQVAVNGEAVEFNSPEAFEEFSKRALGQLQHSPEQFLKQWSELLKSLGNLDDALPADASSFQGIININGQETRFNSREEYEAALKNFLPQ